jgi:hypothetical protein
MFILQALIEEQQRLIFMEKKIIKAGKGREREAREVWFLSLTSRGCGRLGCGSAHHPAGCGGGAQPRRVGLPWTLNKRPLGSEPFLGFRPRQRTGWASPKLQGQGRDGDRALPHDNSYLCPCLSCSQPAFQKHVAYT